jgi:hypothetical protein
MKLQNMQQSDLLWSRHMRELMWIEAGIIAGTLAAILAFSL